MCQLLGMNCATPTDITFSFTGFAARGGHTDHHADGFGVAFFENKACRVFIDNQPSCKSPVAELIKNYPIKSKNVIAHIRKATQGNIDLENCHPFMRELWGRHWIFAHNGDLHGYGPELGGQYQPVGQTDSEIAFCHIMQGLRYRFGNNEPAPQQLFSAIQELTHDITVHGVFNFLLSNGRSLFAHCSTQLYYIVREWPFNKAHLIDADMTVDFSQTNRQGDCVSVIATKPLTDNETWTRLEPGQLVMFEKGLAILQALIPIPESVQKKNSENTACV
ncbi:MAG TPA: class II glutamine amidotransferase [Eoetvoesiella sp.]